MSGKFIVNNKDYSIIPFEIMVLFFFYTREKIYKDYIT